MRHKDWTSRAKPTEGVTVFDLTKEGAG